MTTIHRSVTIKGQRVRFSSKMLKSGETAYYRDGKRVDSGYQKRLARGVLAGKSVQEARGHPFGAYSGKAIGRSQIRKEFPEAARLDNGDFAHFGAWAEPARASGRGRERATYYMKVMVTSESLKKSGSPTGEGEVCTAVTLPLLDPSRNDQIGFTYREVARNFEQIALFTIRRRGLTLCHAGASNDPATVRSALRQDVLAVWRHARR